MIHANSCVRDARDRVGADFYSIAFREEFEIARKLDIVLSKELAMGAPT